MSHSIWPQLARNAAANSHDDIVVELVEVATDKENVLRLLNNAAGTHITQGVAYTAKAKLKADGRTSSEDHLR